MATPKGDELLESSAVFSECRRYRYVLRRIWLTDEEEQGYYQGFANEGLWPGQFVKAEIVLGIEENALAVPAAAIQLGPQGPYLFVVKDGKVAELRQVEIRRTQNLESVIGKGVNPGEQVVIDGQLRLVNGAAVQARPQQNEPPKPGTQPRG